MKEASGEANMTVITILLIAIVGAVGTVIINSMMSTAKSRAKCVEDGGYWDSSAETCKGIDNTTGVGTPNGTPNSDKSEG